MAGTGGGGADPGRRALEDRFISCWADIAGLWGVSPTHGRIHALLFLARRPVDAETIEGRLAISHGSCSTGLQELLSWGVIRRVNVPGLRRAKYATDPDGWKWFHRCVRERRRRDIDPLIRRVREAGAFAEEEVLRAREERRPGLLELVETRDRVLAFTRFMEEFEGLVDAFLATGGRPPGPLVRAFLRAAGRGGGAARRPGEGR